MAIKKVALTKEQRLANKLKALEKDLKPFADRARQGAKSYNAGIFAIGSALADAQEYLSKPGRKGLFKHWLQAEFGYSKSTAYNYIGAFKAFGKCPSDLAITDAAMYLLAPHPEAVTRAINLDKIGHEPPIGVERAKQLVFELNGQAKAKASPKPKAAVSRAAQLREVEGGYEPHEALKPLAKVLVLDKEITRAFGDIQLIMGEESPGMKNFWEALETFHAAVLMLSGRFNKFKKKNK